jgi:glycosyltransferase involved in cell wall biosynthesis
MHILIIPSWYPENPEDISGSFFREQAIALVKRGHKVGVISPHIRTLRNIQNIFKTYGVNFQSDEGVNTFRYFMLNFIPKMDFWGLKGWIRFGSKLYQNYVRNFGVPDIIHVHSLDKAAFLAYEINKNYKIPYVITEHSTAFARGMISEKKINDLYHPVRKAKARIAVSMQLCETMKFKFKDTDWNYLPNIVSSRFFDFENSINKAKNSDFTFINICLLDKKKRVDLLIFAFAELCKLYKNIKLEIGGDGPCHDELVELVEKLELNDRVIFLGMLSRDSVVEKIASADVFVLSSEFETFGVVLIEALALGKPIVATKCGGPESIINENVGVLVEKNSVASLFEGMHAIYKNKDRYLGEQIKEYCIENFSESSVIEKLEDIYSDSLALN